MLNPGCCASSIPGVCRTQPCRSACPSFCGPHLARRSAWKASRGRKSLTGLPSEPAPLRHERTCSWGPAQAASDVQTSSTTSANGAGSTGHQSSPAAASNNTAASNGATSPSAAAAEDAPFTLKPIYVLIFALLFLGGLIFASMSLQLTSDMGFRDALTKVVRRIFRSIAFRQLVVITACMFLVRFALNNVLRFLAKWSSSPVQWDKSKMYYVMKEVYSPLELLLFIAGCCTIADSFVPQLINVPKATVTHVVRAVLSMSFVVGASVVVYNLKSRFCKEQAWQCEMQGDVTSQRRWEAYDKLGTFAIYVIGTILVIQALGLEVRSVLAIGGIGGLAIGLAGREICENLLNGFLLMTTMPFEVGEEVLFRPNGQTVEGIVVDVGWYRTLIRSFEREMYVIPNAVFSKNTVLNVTRKNREWRFYEYLCVRVQDVHKVNAIIQDIRRIVRNDSRIINKLHRRVFLDKISLDDVKIYLSFYCEASNRDAFMAIKQDLLLAFVDCVERNGAKLAQPRTVLEMDQETMLQTRLGLGLLPAPGGSVSGFSSSRNSGSNIPITVQVVDSVDVTATAVPVGNGNGSGKGGSSSGSSSPKGSGGSSSSSGKGAAAGGGSTEQQLQPAAAAAAAGGGAVAYAAAGVSAGVAAGMAADGSSAAAGVQKGDSSSSSTPPLPTTVASPTQQQETTNASAATTAGSNASSPDKNKSTVKATNNASSSSRSSAGGSSSGRSSPRNSSSSSSTTAGSGSANNAVTYTVVSGPAPGTVSAGGSTYPSSAWPRQENTMTVLASFDDL